MTLRVHPDEILATDKSPLLGKAAHWERVRLGDFADILNGYPFPSSGFGPTGDMPLIRIRDIGNSDTDTWFSGSYPTDYVVQPGALLVGMDGDFRAATWTGPPALLNQRVCKIMVRSTDLYSPSFLSYVLPGYLDAIRRATSAVTVKHLSSETLKVLPLPLPPRAEQERIVTALEEEFSRLNAGLAALERARRRLEVAIAAVIVAAIPDQFPDGWRLVTVAQAGDVQLGRQRSPKYHYGPNMRPYLRVANVFEDRIDTSDVMTMHFDPDEYERYRLRPGDILLNEGQSPHLLGRPAMYRGDPPDVAFTNSLLRFRAREGVSPEWALLVFRRHLHTRRFMQESQITTNIAHLSAGRFKTIEFLIPSMAEQSEVVRTTAETLAKLAMLIAEAQAIEGRAALLRTAVLAAAFRGHLVQHGSQVRADQVTVSVGGNIHGGT